MDTDGVPIEPRTLTEAPGTASASEAPSWGAYLWWGVIGAFFGMGVAALLSIGVLLLLIAMLLTLGSVRRPALRNRSALGILGGVASVFGYLAWLNRGGPGEVCEMTGLETRCTEAVSPWPFVAVALLLLAAAVIAARLLARRAAGHSA